MKRSDSASNRGEERTNDAEPTDGTVAGAAAAGLSRRRFLRASAAATAAGVGLGASGSAAAERVEENCETDATNPTDIGLDEDWLLINNVWGMESAQQCIWLEDDGTFGYDIDSSGLSTDSPNYPQTLLGTKPWGTDTGAADFPVRRDEVDELILEIDADVGLSGGEWNLAEEWWLLEQPVSQETQTHRYEIMLVLDWSSQHQHGNMIDRGAWTDQFGNTIDHWTTYTGGGGTNADFYIFRVQGGMQSGKVDMKEIIDYLSENHGVRSDLLVSGIEVGDEYWGDVTGTTTYNEISVTVNGNTYTTGSGTGDDNGNTGGSDTTAPSSPENFRTVATGDTSITVSWESVSDSGGSGLDHYVVSGGGREVTVPAGTTEATIENLQPATTYDLSVVAVDGAGNESSPATHSTATESSDDNGGGESSTVSVDLASADIGTGAETTAAVVLDEAPGGVSGFDVTVSVADPSVASISSASVGGGLNSIGDEPSPSGGGSTASISGADLSESVSEGATDVELATVTLVGQSDGETDVSVDVSNLDANDGDELSVSTGSATLTVGTTGPSWPEDATDPDGDGTYEDLNGNGEADYSDVVEYFNNMDEPEMTNNVEYYDYNGNSEIDFADVVDLFGEVQ
ncbi:fibronectin type III domain-containing protein [Halomicrobium salinisoli]|uniref:fibronectin type III domain-containing protein n=1 Tax=Halomicrobium salinisoli TaxID=2878391 RepID=UPI001CF0CA97|nr:fibronectin type III domain-containing protein [Halomicrobium salinisoli]